VDDWKKDVNLEYGVHVLDSDYDWEAVSMAAFYGACKDIGGCFQQEVI